MSYSSVHRLVTTALLLLLLGGCSSSCSDSARPSRVDLLASKKPRLTTDVLVAAIQTPSRMGDVAGNTRRLERLTRRAAAKGARVVVYPEAAVTGYLSQDLKVSWHVNGLPLHADFQGRSPAGVALTRDGHGVQRFVRLARALKIYIVVPFVELEPRTGKYFNSATLVGPDGAVLSHYRKINPWPYPEDAWATPGDKLAVVKTPLGRFGLLICYDIHTLPQRLARAGAEVLLYPIAWVDDAGSSWFDRELPSIAKKHGVAIVGANWSVEHPRLNKTWHGAGQSRIIDGQGAVVAAAKGDVGEEILYARLRRGQILAAK